MTRDEAIRVGVFTLADWHRRDHGERCVCLEGEQLGAQSAAMVDALAAEGMHFEGYTGDGSGGGRATAVTVSWRRRRWVIILVVIVVLIVLLAAVLVIFGALASPHGGSEGVSSPWLTRVTGRCPALADCGG